MQSSCNHAQTALTHHQRAAGCMLGGALGDALGAPVEFLSLAEIRQRYGDAGIVRLEPVYGRIGAITDDTQMLLFTAEGLLLSKVRGEYDHGRQVTAAIYHAYLRWLYTQDIDRQQQLVGHHGTCVVIDGILTGHRGLFATRAPGQTCLSALRSGLMGTMQKPLNESKGCGGVMRVAPIGLFFRDPEKAFQLGCESAAITHGHPTGYLAAGFLAALISQLVSGVALPAAITGATRILTRAPGHTECLTAVETAVERVHRPELSPRAVESLGAGWVAEEALAISLYCSLAAGDDFKTGVLLAVNHSGDSDSTGAITGNILGACNGLNTIPSGWTAELELRDVIEELAADLAGQTDT